MKKFLLLLLFILLVFVLILIAPVSIFFYSLHSLDFSEKTFVQELSALSALVVIEDPKESKDETQTVESQNQVITITITDEQLSDMFYDELTIKQFPGLILDSVEMTISPEMVSLTISWHCGLFGYQFCEMAVFSEWLTNFSEAKLVEVTPTNIYTNHLYTINWTTLWKYLNKTQKSKGWLTLSSFAQMNIQDVVLKEHEVAITVGLIEDEVVD